MSDPIASAPSRRTRVIVLSLTALAIVAGLIVYYRQTAAPDVIDPPAPDLSDTDPAVRRVIKKEQAAVRKSPASGDAWGRLGMAFYAHVFPTEAFACFEQAETLDPKNPRWAYFRGLIRVNDDPWAAVAELRRAVELSHKDDDVARLRLGELHLQLGQVDEAREQFRAILNGHPTHARAHLGLARLDFLANELPQSREHLRSALTDPYSRKSALVLSAEIHNREGDVRAARAELASSVTLPDDPNWPDKYVAETSPFRVGEVAQLRLAGQLLDQGRVPDAIRLLRVLVQDYPRSAASWTLLGWALLIEVQLEDAERVLRTATELDPESARAWMTLGVVRIRRGDRPAGMANLRTAIARRPNYLDAHFNLGVCLKEDGNLDAAIDAFQNAIRCQPLSAQSHAQLGEVCWKNGNGLLAREHLEQAVELNPKDSASRKLLEEVRAKAPK